MVMSTEHFLEKFYGGVVEIDLETENEEKMQ
jgi:hypothetical protein